MATSVSSSMKDSVENWTPVLLTLSLASLLVAIWLRSRRGSKKYTFPTGPRGVPLFGNMFSLVKTPIHLKLSEWARQFGDMYTVHLGPRKAVVVNDVAKMKELFGIFPAATGKFLTDTFKMPFKGKYGLAVLDSQEYQEQRQFCMKNLKTFGLGKGSTMEPKLIEEVNDLMAWLQTEGAAGRPISISGALQRSTFNALWTLVTGDKVPLEDNRYVDILENIIDSAQRSVSSGVAFLPWLRHIRPESGYKWMQETTDESYKFITDCFKEHETTLQDGTPRDLVDAFLQQERKENDPNSTFYGEVGRKNSVASVVAMFIGGGETSASTITWLIFYLCYEQQVQRKLREEIDRVIGMDREPSLKDKTSMPYTEAVILETLRKSSFLPMGTIHELTEDVQFHDYNFPKGTLIISNLYRAHYNRDIWGDPERFRPERFLTGDKSLKENMVAFQVGRRQCLGEGFAKETIFLFITKLFQHFYFSPDPSIDMKQYLEPTMGFFLAPKRLPVLVTPRKICS